MFPLRVTGLDPCSPLNFSAAWLVASGRYAVEVFQGDGLVAELFLRPEDMADTVADLLAAVRGADDERLDAIADDIASIIDAWEDEGLDYYEDPEDEGLGELGRYDEGDTPWSQLDDDDDGASYWVTFTGGF